MINPATGTYFNIRIKPDFVADTTAEVESDLATYSDKYIMILDQGSKIFYVYHNDNTYQLVDAVDSENYEVENVDPSLVLIGTFDAIVDISGGSLVNFVLISGNTKIQYADSSLGLRADGFIVSAVHASAPVKVYSEGNNTSLGSLDFPAEYYLGVAGAVTTSPPNPTDPLNAGQIVQRCGVTTDDHTLQVSLSKPLYL